MFCFIILIVIMAGFDDNHFSLSRLMQEGHDFVMVIESSSSDDENYHGLLECAQQLAGESDKSSVEGGMQGRCRASCHGPRCCANCVKFADSENVSQWIICFKGYAIFFITIRALE